MNKGPGPVRWKRVFLLFPTYFDASRRYNYREVAEPVFARFHAWVICVLLCGNMAAVGEVIPDPFAEPAGGWPASPLTGNLLLSVLKR